MPNANVISRLVGANSPAQGKMAIPSIVPASASAAVALDQTGAAAILQVGDSNAQPTGAQTYGSGFDGFPFKVRVCWKVLTKASNNITVAIGTPGTTATTYTSGNLIATTGAVACNSGNFNGMLEAVVLWDSSTAKLCGWYQGYINATVLNSGALTTLTNAVAITAQSSLQFVIATTMSDQTAGTTMTITEFVAESL